MSLQVYLIIKSVATSGIPKTTNKYICRNSYRQGGMSLHPIPSLSSGTSEQSQLPPIFRYVAPLMLDHTNRGRMLFLSGQAINLSLQPISQSIFWYICRAMLVATHNQVSQVITKYFPVHLSCHPYAGSHKQGRMLILSGQARKWMWSGQEMDVVW